MFAQQTLILIPTHAEASKLVTVPPIGRSHVTVPELNGRPRAVLTGFGLAAAGTLTARHLGVLRPRQALLVGLAGTLDPDRAPIGSVFAATSVVSDGIGVGQGDAHQGADSLGFVQAPGLTGHSLSLTVPPCWQGSTGITCSVASASEHDQQAVGVRSRQTDACLEDMETWAVAIACRDADIPLTVLRAVSNIAGSRDRSEWRIDPALEILREAMISLFSSNGTSGEASATV